MGKKLLSQFSAEEFLVFLLDNSLVDVVELRPTIQDFVLSRLVGECFDIGEVEKRYPFLVDWLERTAAENKNVSA